jgi:hypothetical protein
VNFYEKHTKACGNGIIFGGGIRFNAFGVSSALYNTCLYSV